MLGRYTPAAIECANMTRMHAMTAASGVVEPEHLAMALVMASPTLFDWLAAEQVESVRQAVDPGRTPRDACRIVLTGGTGAGGMPPGPSAALARVIDRSAEDADRLKHRRIAPEHLLASLLAEPDVPAVTHLVALGVTRARVLEDLTSGRAVPGVDPPTRESLKRRMEAWIDRLAVDDLNPVEMMVDAAERHDGQRRSHHMPEPDAGRPLSGEPPWGIRMPKGFLERMAQRGASSRSSSTTDGDTHVFTTRRTIHGHEITTVERFRADDDGRAIVYSQEVRGPGHASERQIEFRVPPAPEIQPDGSRPT